MMGNARPLAPCGRQGEFIAFREGPYGEDVKIRVLQSEACLLVTVGNIYTTRYAIPLDELFGHIKHANFERMIRPTVKRLGGQTEETFTDPVPLSMKRKVRSRDGVRCRYCEREGVERKDPDGQWWCIDHITPRSAGGRNDLDNLVLACWRCNASKGDSTDPYWRRRVARTDPNQQHNKEQENGYVG